MLLRWRKSINFALLCVFRLFSSLAATVCGSLHYFQRLYIEFFFRHSKAKWRWYIFRDGDDVVKASKAHSSGKQAPLQASLCAIITQAVLCLICSDVMMRCEAIHIPLSSICACWDAHQDNLSLTNSLLFDTFIINYYVH